MFSKQLQKFIKLESSAGLLLFGCLLLALLVKNSPLSWIYDEWLKMPIIIQVGLLKLQKPALLWVNDGLMAVFFMLLALEIKREVLEGDLADKKQVTLPVIGALGGIFVPAAFYLFFNYHDPQTFRGWPIPTTTDIAFTLGVVALLGRRVPSSLKVFLVALSIADDILAIAIIAVFYTAKLSYLSLYLSAFGIFILILLNRLHVKSIAAYMIVGVAIWVCVLKSGVHATLAGVIVGFAIPMRCGEHSPLRELEKKLHPWVAYAILPLFVFSNGGIPFESLRLSEVFNNVSLGIIAGLSLGKPIGVFSFSWVAIKAKLGRLPEGCRYWHLLGISSLTGIGFTMSLFLASLAFVKTPYAALARQGVIYGSLCSLLVSTGIFMMLGNVNNNANEAVAGD
jgi:Na+:H+ antiporter, NhaA family